MRTIWQRILAPAVALAMLLPAVAMAQSPKPVLVISIAGVDEVFGDVDYIAKASGTEAFGAMFKTLAAPYTVGVDKTKAWGVIVKTDGDNVMPLGFVPVKDIELVFAALKEQIGEPKDAGDGVWEVEDPAPLFIKQHNGFAFISNEMKHLDDLPDDPVALLDGLNKEYDVGVRAILKNVPQDKKDMAITQLRAQYERALEQQLQGKEEDDPEYQLTKSVSESQLKRMTDLINDTDQITIGWSTDGMAKKTYLDVNLIARDDTPTSARIGLLRNNKTAFSGFKLADAAVTLTLTARMDKEDMDQMKALMATVREKAMEEIEKDNDLPDEAAKDKAKEVVGGLIDVLTKTCEDGKLDGGAALVLGEKQLTFVTGGRVADGAGLEDALRKLVDLAKNEPDFPGVKFDAETYKGIDLHTMQVPVPEGDDARKVFGEKLDVVVGIGEKSAYLSLGHEAAATLKKVVDESSQGEVEVELPMHLVVSLAPIFKFASSIEDNPVVELISSSLQEAKGTDHIILKEMAEKNGVTFRLEVEEGVLKAIGEASKFAGGGL